jgi:hypothetical protein
MAFRPPSKREKGANALGVSHRPSVASFTTVAGGTIHSFDLRGPATRPVAVWNFMKTTITREAAIRRTPRKSSPTQAKTPSTRPAASDWVWPGLTRADLRAIVIDQIG